MRKIIVTEWMSLDGITDAGTMAEWFNPYHSDSRANAIRETIHNSEIMLYGRVTYQMLYPYWSALKNNEMGVAEKLNTSKKYVVSASLTEAPWEHTTIIKEDPVRAITELRGQEGGPVLVQGSATLVKTLAASGLVDEWKLLVQPHIMGTGAGNLFPGIHASLELMQVQQLEKGVLQLCYGRENK
ncbi:dihydrofolate reductase family protein [Niabella pedocola]|uniref:Dihydrofolate reductase family protein n=1 Tax=Niabella pedocola TaxID=1752077 RepID=A0ABS8PT39_9BACT|nr:dihydrofolate reductase family protein [Niabella pedocola]MCD2424233.1 dihydrofolate reductase family protein [Niabella pedocola]